MHIYRNNYKKLLSNKIINKGLPPKDGWVNAGGVVVLLNRPPAVAPEGFELNNEVLLLPKTGVVPLPKLVVAIGLPNVVCPNGLDCCAVVKPAKTTNNFQNTEENKSDRRK